MKTLGVIANCQKPRATVVLDALASEAERLGLSLVAFGETASLLGEGCRPCDPTKLAEDVDAVLVLGGDGTMLSAVRLLDGHPLPLMGVNIGSLGFMTSVSETELHTALQCLRADTVTRSERCIADCRVRRECEIVASYRALNDVVLSNGSSSRIVTLDVYIDDDHVTSYVCDGLIVSTPTGSTGHSLSAGGPIVMPSSPVFVLSLICPHTLSSRPLVISEASRITIAGQSYHGELALAVDGQVGQVLAEGDRIEISRCATRVTFLHLPDHSYFSVLRQKLRWSGSSTPGR